jgi:hypothetical protein
MDAGRFREDLYYRLNGLTLSCRRCASADKLALLAAAAARDPRADQRASRWPPAVAAGVRGPTPGRATCGSCQRAAHGLRAARRQRRRDRLVAPAGRPASGAARRRTATPAGGGRRNGPRRAGVDRRGAGRGAVARHLGAGHPPRHRGQPRQYVRGRAPPGHQPQYAVPATDRAGKGRYLTWQGSHAADVPAEVLPRCQALRQALRQNRRRRRHPRPPGARPPRRAM